MQVTQVVMGAHGGTGNPGGGASSWGGAYRYNGTNGTGGLLIMYANSIINNATVSSNGVMCKTVGYASGGSSGAGSINIFYKEKYICADEATINTKGGTGGNGGAGGDGTATIGSIETGNFVKYVEDE